jgi:hypothetical protein
MVHWPALAASVLEVNSHLFTRNGVAPPQRGKEGVE